MEATMTEQTPLYTALKKYMEQAGLRLHMPGHAGKNWASGLEVAALAGLDVTEIPGMDDLHLPQGIIASAQQLLARACGAEISLMLVNGASAGIQALLLCGGDQERVMIPRNAHRSFYGGLVLSGAMPIYIPCEMEPELGIALAVRREAVEDIMAGHLDVGTVFVTSPSYYGSCSDIAGIAAVLGRTGLPLLVDEAHGAHFPFHPAYPSPALQQGAAAVVSGLHKTWPVLTQGACLHLGPGFERHQCLRAAYDLLTTTSPSYPLMASIDLARAYMEREGRARLEQGLDLAREFKPRFNEIPGLRCYGDELLKIPGVIDVDPLKVLISLPGLSLSGYQLDLLLGQKYNIQVEMAADNYILAMFSLLHQRDDWQRFYLALQEIACLHKAAGEKRTELVVPPPVGMIELSPRQAFFAAKRRVALADCRGQVAGEMVAAYPPGIPCLLPGERITEQVWDYLHYLQRTGARIQGPIEADLEHLIIID
jgi:arginine decarboxylase